MGWDIQRAQRARWRKGRVLGVVWDHRETGLSIDQIQSQCARPEDGKIGISKSHIKCILHDEVMHGRVMAFRVRCGPRKYEFRYYPGPQWKTDKLEKASKKPPTKSGEEEQEIDWDAHFEMLKREGRW